MEFNFGIAILAATGILGYQLGRQDAENSANQAPPRIRPRRRR